MIIELIKKFTDLIWLLENELNKETLINFLKWFNKKIIINFQHKIPDYFYPSKWEIYYVEMWMNIGSEINKTRPCIVYSNQKYNKWNTLLIIPIKWFYWKIDKKFQILISPTEENNLWKTSLATLMSINEISKKRIKWKLWNLEKIHLNEINQKLYKILI